MTCFLFNTAAYFRREGTLLIIFAICVGGCASSPRFTRARTAEPKNTTSASGSSTTANKVQSYEGLASYYAHDFNGKKTANGETYDMYQLTAAHRSFPFGTKVKVTNLDNNKSVVIRVNDRGPFVLNRIMDVSLGAATQLDMLKKGTAHVRLEVVEWGDDEYVK